MEYTRLSKILLHRLLGSSEGEPHSMTTQFLESQCGFEAWRSLCSTYGGGAHSNQYIKLTAIINPKWSSASTPQEMFKMYTQWVQEVDSYETQRHQIQDELKISVIMNATATPSSTRNGHQRLLLKTCRRHIRNGSPTCQIMRRSIMPFKTS